MKITSMLATVTLALVALESANAQQRKGLGRGKNKEKAAERSALWEGFKLDKKDTHGRQSTPGKDRRPENLDIYHKVTYERIVTLLKAGKIKTEEGTEFKLAHTEVTIAMKESKLSEGSLSSGRKDALRKELDKINDSINAVVQEGDQGDKRTPTLNTAQHRFEELIEFGKRSGRLSSGEASRPNRKLSSLERLEERLKNGASLSDRERVQLHEEAIEIRREIFKELKD